MFAVGALELTPRSKTINKEGKNTPKSEEPAFNNLQRRQKIHNLI
jgi:hypothetical protein